MDTEELIWRCKAITLSREGEGRVSLQSRMRAKGEKIVAGCLLGKVMTNKSVNKEGLKIALQQAWQNIREVKIESLGIMYSCFKLLLNDFGMKT